jgi:hypothetical protein
VLAASGLSLADGRRMVPQGQVSVSASDVATVKFDVAASTRRICAQIDGTGQNGGLDNPEKPLLFSHNDRVPRSGERHA